LICFARHLSCLKINMSTPPEFLPVLLGIGSFIRDTEGYVVFGFHCTLLLVFTRAWPTILIISKVRKTDTNFIVAGSYYTFLNGGNPRHILPCGDAFLDMRPSKQARQGWPQRGKNTFCQKDAIVLLAVTVNTDCRDDSKVTEIGYTIFDTAAIFDGVTAHRRKLEGCGAPGSRGVNLYKFATTRHYIVKEREDHHPKTCNNFSHVAQPYHFSFRKSEIVKECDIEATLDQVFDLAARQGLSRDAIQREQRRNVVLLGWGGQHAAIRNTTWFKQHKMFEYWDFRLYSLMKVRFPYGCPAFLHCLDAFGVQHKAHGMEIGHNAGNRSAFLVRLLISVCFLTVDDRTCVNQQINLEPSTMFPGVESVLARVNRPPGYGPLPEGHTSIFHR
jgi:hypothetical protein